MRRLAERMNWENVEQERGPQWDDFAEDEAMPLLDVLSGMTLKRWTPPELPGPWNNSYSKPFVFDGWKPPSRPIGGRRQSTLTSSGHLFTCYLILK